MLPSKSNKNILNNKSIFFHHRYHSTKSKLKFDILIFRTLNVKKEMFIRKISNILNVFQQSINYWKMKKYFILVAVTNDIEARKLKYYVSCRWQVKFYIFLFHGKVFTKVHKLLFCKESHWKASIKVSRKLK